MRRGEGALARPRPREDGGGALAQAVLTAKGGGGVLVVGTGGWRTRGRGPDGCRLPGSRRPPGTARHVRLAVAGHGVQREPCRQQRRQRRRHRQQQQCRCLWSDEDPGHQNSFLWGTCHQRLFVTRPEAGARQTEV